jgi:hypothetical protein
MMVWALPNASNKGLTLMMRSCRPDSREHDWHLDHLSHSESGCRAYFTCSSSGGETQHVGEDYMYVGVDRTWSLAARAHGDDLLQKQLGRLSLSGSRLTTDHTHLFITVRESGCEAKERLQAMCAIKAQTDLILEVRLHGLESVVGSCIQMGRESFLVDTC